jgi:hypothetical protein
MLVLIVSKHNIRNSFFERRDRAYTDKKENTIFSHIQDKYIQMGSGPKSYVKKGFLIYEEMRKFFTTYMRRPLVIYDFAPDPSEFPYI